ncbi:MAG: hypothetical protein ACTTKC_09340 [Treponema sp.]|uniref:hypothetical protein n=1 Tax=Treponema sp. TaxID=166 RepID=UPI003FA1A717
MTEREAAVRRCNDELIKRYGAVVRARGPYLYTQKGVRLTDLYLDAGRAVLGRGCSGSNAFRVLKNTLERGETGSFPSAYSTRFQKAVLSLIPGYDYAARFSTEDSLLRAAALYTSERTTGAKQNSTGTQGAVGSPSAGLRVKLWRPWQTETADSADGNSPYETLGTETLIAEGILAFYPPLALQEAGLIAVFKAGNNPFPLSDLCSGALLNALTRSIYDLQREIPKRGEKEWSRFDAILSPYFERKGAYLIPKIEGAQYENFVNHCLDCRLLIPPYPAPALVPVGVNEGDFSRLKQTPFKCRINL